MAISGTSGTAGTDSMVEGVKKIASQIASLKFYPDADMQFIQALEEACVGWVQQKSQEQAQQAAGMATQAAGNGSQAMMGGAGASGLGGGFGGGNGGAGNSPAGPSPLSISPGGGAGMSGFGAPNPDELRRLLSNPNGG